MKQSQKSEQPRLLLVANVAKEHVLKFHVPTIKMLKEKGWHVDVACSGEEEIPYCDAFYKMSYKRSPFNFSLFVGIKDLLDVIKKGNYDIVYCHTPVGGLAARIAARKARKQGTKVIYFAHGFHFFKGASLLNWLLYYPMEKILSWMTDSIMLINTEDYTQACEKFRNCKAYLLDGIGVNTSRLEITDRQAVRESYRTQMDIPQDATVLIYLAELLPNKNQTFLMRVLKKVLESDQNVYLVLAGFDHSDGAFEKYAEEIGVKDHVRFLGWREDVGNLYSMADICTATSIREGFGLNLVEAMYCQIPVVATQNRGHATIIRDGENGFLVDLDDEAMFAAKIQQLIHDPELAATFVRIGKEEQTKYSCDAVCDKIYAILQEHL